MITTIKKQDNMAKVYAIAYEDIVGKIKMNSIPFYDLEEAQRTTATINGWSKIVEFDTEDSGHSIPTMSECIDALDDAIDIIQ